jgi:23S rRNA (uracil1939-C5)-methyltransferase
MPQALIESLDHEARGVTHVDGKVVFVDGALARERVEFSAYRRKPSYENAQLTRLIRPSPFRVAPRCRYFGVCGGCSMQHLDASAQAAVKQRVLEDAFWHIGRLRPETLLPAIQGPAWGYRYRARLAVRDVPKKGGVLVGFHERRSSFVADMQSCEVLPPSVSLLLPRLRELVESLTVRERLPQIEVAIGEDECALVMRILKPLAGDDESRLREFAQRHGVAIWLQTGGPASSVRFWPPGAEPLHYRLEEFDVTIAFGPTDFTQVNQLVNRALVRRAVELLAPEAGERIADMFCGLGNFTLPIARRGARVLGVEGSAALVDKARRNALANALEASTEFAVADLFAATPDVLRAWGSFDKMLIDPPREGAAELVAAIDPPGPRRIVYVSCKPATLARDAAILSHQKGYRLAAAGIANMFPQTSHVESIALFVQA